MIINERIYLSPPHLSGREMEYVEKAIASNWIAPVGPYVDLFEQTISETTGSKYCVVLNSGTSALHLALHGLQIMPGDIVMISTFTFPASAYPILYEGAIPYFVDVEKTTWNIDPYVLEEAIIECIHKNKKPKALILPHIYGMPARIKDIMQIADQFAIPVIEDAAEALGATYHKKQAGTFGKAGIFSFNGNKIVTTSGGGALVSDDAALIDIARFLASQAKEKAPYYEHVRIGYNYRLSNISAAIGCAQMEVLGERVINRRNNFSFYKEQLSEIEGISFQEEPEGAFSNRWLTTILLEDKLFNPKTNDALRVSLEKENIESRPLWKPLHLQPVFAKFPGKVTGIAEELFKNGLSLPSGSGLTTCELERIAKMVKKILSLQHI